MYDVGTAIGAGLPEIKGAFDGRKVGEEFYQFIYPIDNLFTKEDSDNPTYNTLNYISGNPGVLERYTFQASKANNTYGSSNTVQPSAIIVNSIIKY